MNRPDNTNVLLSPATLIKKEKRKILIRSLIVILLTNSIVLFAMRSEGKNEEEEPQSSMNGYQRYITKAIRHVPVIENQAISISSQGKVIIEQALLIKCQHEECEVAIPNHLVERLLLLQDDTLHLYPAISKNPKQGPSYEIML